MILWICIGILISLIIILFLLAYALHHKIFGFRFEVDPLIGYYTQEEFDLKSEPFEFLCGKDKLKGAIYSYGEATKEEIIVFSHGMWSSRRAYMQDIAYYATRGYKVFAYDNTGSDYSEGKSTRGFSQGLKCLDYAIQFIMTETKYKNNKIYVIGHSWGGYATIHSIKYHPNISKIVALAPFASIPRVLYGMLPKPLWILIPFIKWIEAIKNGGYAFSNAVRNLNKYSGHAMIIHSYDDPMVKYEYNTKHLQKKCKNSKVCFEIVNNKKHNPNYTKEAVELLGEYASKLNNLSLQEQEEYKKTVDFHKLGELDSEVMDKIIQFLEQ